MDLSVAVRRQDGSVTGRVQLDLSWFGVEPNVPLMHQVVTAQLAAARAGTQSTRTRAEVRGGGKKPFRQKGTGRARQGSTRAPHWSGGGVALAAKPNSPNAPSVTQAIPSFMPKPPVRRAACGCSFR